MNINWNVTTEEADFILALLNGQQTPPVTVMVRAALIQKLMQQSQEKVEQKAPETPPALGGTDD